MWKSTISTAACGRLLSVLLVLSPGIGTAQTVSPRRLVEVVDLSGPVVSPDGTLVAFRAEQASIERNTYDSTWYVQPIDGVSPPRQVADGGIPLRDTAGLSLLAHAVWSPDGERIYFRALHDGRVDVWEAAVDGSGAQALTNDAADVRDFSLSVDGNTLIYSVGATREQITMAELSEYDGGIRIDAASPVGQGLFRSSYIDGRVATHRLGNWFNRVPLLAEVGDHWKSIDLRGHREKPVAIDLSPADVTSSAGPQPPADDVWKMVAEPHGDCIAWLVRTGEPGGLRQRPDVELVVTSSRGGWRQTKCKSDLCTKRAIVDIQWRPHSNEVLFTTGEPTDGLANAIFRWDVQSGAVTPVVRAGGLMNGGERFRRAGPGCGMASSAIICVAAEADRPPRLERIDLETGARQVLFDPNLSLAQDLLPSRRAKLLKWTDAEGREFTGQYFAASGVNGTPPPLFITYYRCLGFLRGGMGDEWPLAVLASHGISSLCINAPPPSVDAVERYDLGRAAVASIVELLSEVEEIDPAKVGMGGLSFGSEATLWVATHSNLLAAASVSSPPISPLYYLLGSLKGDQFVSGFNRLWQLGPPGETVDRWELLAPALGPSRIKVPVLMQLSEHEYTASLDYAIPLIRQNRAELYVFPHESHQKFQPRHKLAVYERNLDWFRFWLLDEESADQAKSQQYTRWKHMRAGLPDNVDGPPQAPRG